MQIPLFDVFVSDIVIDEISEGDSAASAKRLEVVQGIQKLSITKEALTLAKSLVNGPIPQKAELDAFHIALAANGIDLLLTWNCKHISNPVLRRDIIEVCRLAGFECPIICSPSDFMEK